jgi:1-pyrroline-5-carboxylate dehydrogenase
MAFRVTYSVLNADMTALHQAFDKTLIQVRSELGKEWPSHLGGKELRTGEFISDVNPANEREVLAKFHCASEKDAELAFDVAKKAQRVWAALGWQERNRILRKAADLISERNLRYSAIMSLEAGKNRLESLGDVEESADLLRYYCQQVEDANGFIRPLGKLSPNEDTKDVLKPFGVFVVISPFNFPMALAAGMTGGALLGGNSVILKPSQETPWSAQNLFECFRDAGMPEGVVQVLHGAGSKLGALLATHPKHDGIAFTGSKEVGMKLMMSSLSGLYAKPCFVELGGKNACVVSDKADLPKAVEGVARSAFGLTGQKCSALSRVYVHQKVKTEFTERLIARIAQIKIGDPTLQDVYMGPIINERAMKRFDQAVMDARNGGGKILAGGENLRSKKDFAQGFFVPPTLVEIGHSHRVAREEHFAPYLTLHNCVSFEEGVALVSDSEYGLTGGVFSEDSSEVDYFMDQAEAGVLYANRQTGATTGAWPGIQSFCGWKGSGASGKGGCGPYYVAQFMREQSQTRML